MRSDHSQHPAGAWKRAGLLAGVVALLQLPVVFSHENYLLTWFNIDDGFYYFVTARNIAAGLGVTFDGIAPTNGFHPLWMLVITPIFALPGKILPLRALAFVAVLLNAATAGLIYRLAARVLTPGAAALAGLAFALLEPIHSYTARGGMEVGLSAFLIVLLLDRLAFETGRGANLAGFGALAGLVFLARLDNVFLAGFICAALVLERWARGWDEPWRGRLRTAVLVLAPLGVAAAAYMAWSWTGFRTLTPVSGQVKQWWGTLPNSIYGFPPRTWINLIGQFVTNDPDVGPWSLATAPLYAAAEAAAGTAVASRRIALAVIGGGLAAAAGWLVFRDRDRCLHHARRLGLLPLLLGCLFQIGYYKLSGSVAQRPWYWTAENLWLVLTGAVLLDSAWRTALHPLLGKAVRAPAAWALTATLAALLVAPHLPRLGRIFSPEIALEERFYLQRAAWLEAHTEPGALIGMTGTGSSAYFTDGRQFANLDGLISSYAYFQHLQAGTADEYLARIGLDYVFGNAYIITESDPYAGIFSGRLEEADVFETGDRMLVLWRFDPSTQP